MPPETLWESLAPTLRSLIHQQLLSGCPSQTTDRQDGFDPKKWLKRIHYLTDPRLCCDSCSRLKFYFI